MPANARKIARSTVAGVIALLVSTAPGHAGWREDVGTFRIGMVAEPGAGQSVAGLASLKEAYSTALGLPVEILVARNLPALVMAQADRRIDYAIYSAAAYATAWHLCGCVEPVVAPVGVDGSTGVRAVLLTRAGAAGSPSEAGGREVAVAGTSARSNAAELSKAIASAAGAEPLLVGGISAEEAERRFAEGEVDFILGWEPVDASGSSLPGGGTSGRLVSAGIDAGTLLSLWHSRPLRYGPHAVRSDLDDEAKRLLGDFLAGLKDRRPEVYDLVEFHHQGGFVIATHDEYGTTVEAVGATAAAPRM